MDAMIDLSAPQDNYRKLIEQGGYVDTGVGFAMSYNRADTEFVLRHQPLT